MHVNVLGGIMQTIYHIYCFKLFTRSTPPEFAILLYCYTAILLYCYTAICSHVWLRAIYRRMLRLNQSRAPYCKAGHLYTVDSPNWLESRV